MKIGAIIYGSHANGPGRVTAVWFQGCQNMGDDPTGHCKACWNPGLWDPAGGQETTPEALAEEIVYHSDQDTDGVVFSGGEPLQSAISLGRLIRAIHDRKPEWSMGLFSGYSKAELDSGNYAIHEPHTPDSPYLKSLAWKEIQRHLDWAALGRYDKDRPTPPGSFLSSTNQKLAIYRRYTPADFQQVLEYNIGPEGLTQITGTL